MDTRKEREDDPGNDDRVAYAIEQLKQNIEYTLKNQTIGHFHCCTPNTDKLVQFWAGYR